MWVCMRIWLLCITLLHLKGVNALGVWHKGLIPDWYIVAGQTSPDQLQAAVSFPGESSTSTANRDEKKTNLGAVQTSIAYQSGLSSSEEVSDGSFGQYTPVLSSAQGFQSQNVSFVSTTSNQNVVIPEFQNNNGPQSSGQSGYPSSVTLQASNTVPVQPVRWPQQFVNPFQTRPFNMLLSQPQRASSQLPLATSNYTTQYSSPIQHVLQGERVSVSQPQVQLNTLSGQSLNKYPDAAAPSSSSNISGLVSSTVPGLSRWLAGQSGRLQTQQGVSWLSSVPAFVTQQVPESAVSSGSTSSHTGSRSQSSTVYGASQGILRPSGSFHTPQGINQMSAVLPFVTQPVSENTLCNSSTSSSHTGYHSQSSSGYGVSQGLASQSGSSQTGVSWLKIIPDFTVTQQATQGAVNSGEGSTYTGSQRLVGQPSRFPTQQGISWLSSPVFTLTQQAPASAESNGSTSASNTQIQGSSVSQVLGNQDGGLQTQQGMSWLNFVPDFAVTQQVSESALASGSASSPSIYAGSQIQGSTVYGVSQGIPRPSGSFPARQGINQVSSAPALTGTQQVSESAMSGFTSSFLMPSQSQGSNVSQQLGSQAGRPQTQRGISWLSSFPVSQTTYEGAVASGSTSSISSFHPSSQSQGSSVSGMSQGIPMPYGSFQTLQGIISAPHLTATQQVTENAVSGSTSSTSNAGSQISSVSRSQGLSRQAGSVQTRPGISWLNFAPPFVTQQGTDGGVINASSSSYSGSPRQASSVSGMSQGIPMPYGSFQAQHGLNQVSSTPALTVTQQASEIWNHQIPQSLTSGSHYGP